MIILRPKNVIFEPFWPFSKFHFPACATLMIMVSFLFLNMKSYITSVQCLERGSNHPTVMVTVAEINSKLRDQWILSTLAIVWKGLKDCY